MLIFKNTRPKWALICAARLEDEDFKPPAYDKHDPDTHKWHETLYTKSRDGQVKGGGWTPEGIVQYNDYVAMIHNFRKEDSKNKYAAHIKMHELVQSCRNVTGSEPPRKRQRLTRKKVAEPVYVEVVEMSDDDYATEDDNEAAEAEVVAEVADEAEVANEE